MNLRLSNTQPMAELQLDQGELKYKLRHTFATSLRALQLDQGELKYRWEPECQANAWGFNWTRGN